MDTKELPEIGVLVKGQAKFKCYRDGDLWYEVTYYALMPGARTAEEGNALYSLEFPVPVKDTGTGIFDANMKAITLMRWIRIHREKKLKGEA